MTLSSHVLPVCSPLSTLRHLAAPCCRNASLVAALLAIHVWRSFAVADEIHPATPSVVISARGFDELTVDGLRLLQMAGATERAGQLQTILALLNGASGIDPGRPLGVLVYLSPDEKRDPDLVAFLPVAEIDELQRSIARFEQIKLSPLDDDGWWELRAGRTTLPIRISDGYAFFALRRELLSDPLPSVERWTAPHEEYDVAASIHRQGIPSELMGRALTDLHQQFERDSPRKPDESQRRSSVPFTSRSGAGLADRAWAAGVRPCEGRTEVAAGQRPGRV